MKIMNQDKMKPMVNPWGGIAAARGFVWFSPVGPQDSHWDPSSEL